MFERILVGVDTAGSSDHAVVAAGRLGRATGARLAFLHAIPMFWRSWSKPAMLAWELAKDDVKVAAREATAQRIDALLAGDGQSLPDVTEHVEVVEDNAGQALLARARPGDLLVLGAHRREGLFDFGATARTLLAKTDNPLWIQPAAPVPLRRMVVAVDLSEHTPAVMATVGRLQEALGLELTLVHVFEPPTFAYGNEPAYTVDTLRQDSRAAFERFVGEHRTALGVDPDCEFREGRPADELLKLTGPGDLVVMGTHGHSGVLRVVLGSQAYRVVRHTGSPSLVVPCPERRYQVG
jgi:nucleotide-binding universal stress UspA family protein